MFVHSASLLPAAGVLLLASLPQTLAQTCLSYGIDFVNGGSYFINTNSNVDFTCVTQFSGCQNDTADVILTDPNGNEYECTNIPLQPDYTSELSTCPIEQSAMTSGEWDLLIISNNGDAAPIAYQRDFEITAGPQSTVTATPTLIFNFTSTPTVTSTTTNTFTSGVTINNTNTVTIPSATHTDTITLTPTTITATTTLTRTFKTWTHTAYIVTSTVTASCTVPPRPNAPDPTWHSRPQLVQTLPSGLSPPSKKRDAINQIREEHRKNRRTGRLSDQMEAREVDERNMIKRSADSPTVTVTETTYTVTSTNTVIGTTSTVPDIVKTTIYPTTTLPPSTVFSGVAEQTITAPQSTRTKLSVTTTYTWSVGTITASLTHWSTVTPSASVTACKYEGGHFGPIVGLFGW